MSRASSASAKTEGSIAKGPLQVLTPPPSAQGGAELCAFRPSRWVPDLQVISLIDVTVLISFESLLSVIPCVIPLHFSPVFLRAAVS